jgi:hypothetical protein
MKKWSESEVQELVGPLLKHQPTVSLTKKGSLCIIFTSTAVGNYPILGAYWSGEEWVPARWTKDGSFVQDHSRAMDLILHEHLENEIA